MWYAERRTMTGRWTPELWPRPPHGKTEPCPGEMLIRQFEGRARMRRIFPVPENLAGASLSELQAHFAAAEQAGITE